MEQQGYPARVKEHVAEDLSDKAVFKEGKGKPKGIITGFGADNT